MSLAENDNLLFVAIISGENIITSCLIVSLGKASITARRVSSHALLTPVRKKWVICYVAHIMSITKHPSVLQNYFSLFLFTSSRKYIIKRH